MSPRLVLCALLTPLVLVAGCGPGSPRTTGPERTFVRVVPPTPSAPAIVGPPVHRHWEVEGAPTRVDVDGDGVPETVTVRVAYRAQGRPPAQVVVRFADGRTSTTVLRHQTPLIRVGSFANLDGVPGQEVGLFRDPPPMRTASVLTWRDGRLEPYRTPRRFPLTDDIEQAPAAAYWVERGRLLSTRALVQFHVTYDNVTAPASYPVRAYRWRFTGLRMEPVDLGRFCVDRDHDHVLRACS